MNLYYAKKIGLDIRRYWKNLIRFSVFCIPQIAAAFLIKQALPISSWGSLAIHIVLFSLFYGAVYWFLSSNEYERDLIKGLFAKLRSARL